MSNRRVTSPSLPDDDEENHGLNGRRKRSSILKMPKSPLRPVLQDLDVNQQEEDTKQRTSRRVSFADTYQIKEYLTDSVSLCFWNDTQEKPIPHSDESTSASSEGDPSIGSQIQGLETLLSGKIHSSDADILSENVLKDSVPLPHTLVEDPSLGRKRKGRMVQNRDSGSLHVSAAAAIAGTSHKDKKRRVLQPLELPLPVADGSEPSVSGSCRAQFVGDKTILIGEDMDMTYKDWTITKDISMETNALTLNRTCYSQDAMELTYVEQKTVHATLREIDGLQFGDKTLMFNRTDECDVSLTCFEKSFIVPDDDHETSSEDCSESSSSGTVEKLDAHEFLKHFEYNRVNTIPDLCGTSTLALELVDQCALSQLSPSQINSDEVGTPPDLSNGIESNKLPTESRIASYPAKTIMKDTGQGDAGFRDTSGNMLCLSEGNIDRANTNSSKIVFMSTFNDEADKPSDIGSLPGFEFPLKKTCDEVKTIVSQSGCAKSKPINVGAEQTIQDSVEKTQFYVDMEPTECVTRNIIVLNGEPESVSSGKDEVVETDSTKNTAVDMEETQCATVGFSFPLRHQHEICNSTRRRTIIFDTENADIDTTGVLDISIMVGLPESTSHNKAEFECLSAKGIKSLKSENTVGDNREAVFPVLPLESSNFITTPTPNGSLTGEQTSVLLQEAELALSLMVKRNKPSENDIHPAPLSSELNHMSANTHSEFGLLNLNKKERSIDKLLLSSLSQDEKNGIAVAASEVTRSSHSVEPKTGVPPVELNCPKEMVFRSIPYSVKNGCKSADNNLNNSKLEVPLGPTGVNIPISENVLSSEMLADCVDASSRKRPLIQNIQDSCYKILSSHTFDNRRNKEQKLDDVVPVKLKTTESMSDDVTDRVLQTEPKESNAVNNTSCSAKKLQEAAIINLDHCSSENVSEKSIKHSSLIVSMPCNNSITTCLNEDCNNVSVNMSKSFLNEHENENRPAKQVANCEMNQGDGILQVGSMARLTEFLPNNSAVLVNQSNAINLTRSKTSGVPFEETRCNSKCVVSLNPILTTDQLKTNQSCGNFAFESCRELCADYEKHPQHPENGSLATNAVALNIDTNGNKTRSPLQVTYTQVSPVSRSNLSIVQSPWSLSKQRCNSQARKKWRGNDIGSKKSKTKCKIKLNSHYCSSTAAAEPFTPTKDSAVFPLSDATLTQRDFKPAFNSTMVREAFVLQGSPRPEENISVFTENGSPSCGVSRELPEANAMPGMGLEVNLNPTAAANNAKSNEVTYSASLNVFKKVGNLSSETCNPQVKFVGSPHLATLVQQRTEFQELDVQQTTQVTQDSNNTDLTKSKVPNLFKEKHDPYVVSLLQTIGSNEPTHSDQKTYEICQQPITKSVQSVEQNIIQDNETTCTDRMTCHEDDQQPIIKSFNSVEQYIIQDKVDIKFSTSTQQITELDAVYSTEVKQLVQKITQSENRTVESTSNKEQKMTEEIPVLQNVPSEAVCVKDNVTQHNTNREIMEDQPKFATAVNRLPQIALENYGREVTHVEKSGSEVSKAIEENEAAGPAICTKHKLEGIHDHRITDFVQQSHADLSDIQWMETELLAISPCDAFVHDISPLSSLDGVLDQFSLPIAAQDSVNLFTYPDKASNLPISVLSDSRFGIDTSANAADESAEKDCFETPDEALVHNKEEPVEVEEWDLEDNLLSLLTIADATLAEANSVECRLHQMTSNLSPAADVETLEDINKKIAINETKLKELKVEKEQALRALENTQSMKTKLEAEVDARKYEIMCEESKLVKLEAHVKELQAQDALTRSLVEGNLEKTDNSGVSLTYMWGSLLLKAVYGKELLNASGEATLRPLYEVRSVHLTVNKAALSPLMVLAHNMVLKAADKSLFDSIRTSREMYQVVNHVDLLSAHSRWLTEDVDEIYYDHSMEIEEDKIVIEFSSIEVHTMFNVTFPMTPGHYPEEVIVPTYKQILGKDLEADVIEVLQSVKPGGPYLKRMVEAVDNLLKQTAKYAKLYD